MTFTPSNRSFLSSELNTRLLSSLLFFSPIQIVYWINEVFFFWVNSSFMAKPIGHQNTMLCTMQIFLFTHKVMRGWEPRHVRTNHKSVVLLSKATLQRCSWKPLRLFSPPTERKWNPEWFSTAFIYVFFLSKLTIEDRKVFLFWPERCMQ